MGPIVGSVFGQYEALYVVEREAEVELIHLLVKGFEVPGCLIPSLCRHQVACGLQLSFAGLGILALLCLGVSLGSLLVVAKSL